jgi:hypothetical protein
MGGAFLVCGPILLRTGIGRISSGVFRDSLDGLMPTTVVGLSDDSIRDPDISKHSLCSTAGGSSLFQAMMPPKAACAEAFSVDPASHLHHLLTCLIEQAQLRFLG